MISHDKTQKICKILLQKYTYVIYKVVHHHFQMRYNIFITRIEAANTMYEKFLHFSPVSDDFPICGSLILCRS